jgi:hypothetical protein
MRKFGMKSVNVFKNSDLLTTNEIFKMSKDVDSLFPILGKSIANANNKLSEAKLSKITSKLKSDDERQKRFREGSLTETDRRITFKKLVNKAISSRDSTTLLNSSIKKDLSKFKYFEKNLSEN